MAIIKYDKRDRKSLSLHFSSNEFNCPCSDCKETLVSDTLVERLEKMRVDLGVQLHVTSGYRCKGYQEQLRLRGYETATGISQHELGNAADISNGVLRGDELAEAAEKAGFTCIGVGKTWCHLDVRPGPKRWSYKR